MKELENRFIKKSICSSARAYMEMRLMTHKKKEMYESKF